LSLLIIGCGKKKKRRRVLYGALSKLEPCVAKVTCTVLRGLSGGDITWLPDHAHESSLTRMALPGGGSSKDNKLTLKDFL
jgi:hypothetical protein